MAKVIQSYECADKSFNFEHSCGMLENHRSCLKLHKHNDYQLMYILNGSIIQYIEGEKFMLKAGTVAILSSDELHMLSEPDDEYERIIINISCDILKPFKLDYDLFRVFKQRKKGITNIITKDSVNNFNLDYYLARIQNKIQEDFQSKDLILKCYIIELLVELDKAFTKGHMVKSIGVANTVKDAFNYINEHLTEKISLDDISKSLFITKTYLCHVFKKKTGMSIVQYISKKRVYLANDLIDRGMPATKASVKAGFRNYSNFYKAYTKIMGHSPTGKKNNTYN